MKHSLSILITLGVVAGAHAQIALDNAQNSVYIVGQEYIQVGTTPGDQTAATNGLNGGFGFERWQRGGYGDNGNFGSNLITSINSSFNMGSKQFGLRSGVGGLDFSGTDARRRLLNDVGLNEVVSFSLMPGGNGAGVLSTVGDFGVEFRGSSLSNPGRDLFGMNASFGQNYSLQDESGSRFTGIPVVGGQRLDVQVVSYQTNKFTVILTPFGGASEKYELDSYGSSAALNTALRTIQFYAYQTNGDSYVNFLRVESFASLSGSLALGNTTFGGAFTRNIVGTIKQGNTILGTIAVNGINSGTASFSGTVPISATGPATIEWDGSSFLLRKTNVTLSGTNLGLGTINLQNGDVDNSGEVDAADIDIVIANFGATTDMTSDVDVSGEVDAADIDIVIANFGGVND